jgi:hypothetical protein
MVSSVPDILSIAVCTLHTPMKRLISYFWLFGVPAISEKIVASMTMITTYATMDVVDIWCDEYIDW